MLVPVLSTYIAICLLALTCTGYELGSLDLSLDQLEKETYARSYTTLFRNLLVFPRRVCRAPH